MTSHSIEIFERVYLCARIEAKYKASRISRSKVDSNIEILESHLSSIRDSNEYDFHSSLENSLEFKQVQGATIQLDDEELEEYRFKEDLNYLRVDNICLDNHLIEGSKTFGLLNGDARFFLTRSKIIHVLDRSLPSASLEIVFPDVKKKRFFKRIKKRIWELVRLLSLIFLIYLLVVLVSSIDFSSNRQRVRDWSSEVSENLNSTTLYLKSQGLHNVARMTIGNTNRDYLLDTGASLTTVPQSYIDELIKKGIVNPELDFVEYAQFSIANGATMQGSIWRIRKMNIEGYKVYNVNIAVSPGEKAPYLLGMSTLSKLGKYSLFPEEGKIVIYEK